MGRGDPGSGRAQRPRRRWAWLLALGLGCGNSGGSPASRGPWRAPDPSSQRPTGCIDTPFIGPDARSSADGVVCGREASPAAALLRGRVLAEAAPGLPGAGLEDLWVCVHAGAGLRLDRLPPAQAEVRTGPQGAFAVALSGPGEYLIAVRAERDGAVLGARRIVTSADAPPPELTLLVPVE